MYNHKTKNIKSLDFLFPIWKQMKLWIKDLFAKVS